MSDEDYQSNQSVDKHLEDDFVYLDQWIEQANHELASPFAQKYKQIMQLEVPVDSNVDISEAFDSVADLEISFKKILDMTGFVLTKKKKVDTLFQEANSKLGLLEARQKAEEHLLSEQTESLKLQVREQSENNIGLEHRVNLLESELSEKQVLLQEYQSQLKAEFKQDLAKSMQDDDKTEELGLKSSEIHLIDHNL